MGGGSSIDEVSARLGLPVDLLQEAEGFKGIEGGVYPDNILTVKIFCDMATQWRVGMNGLIGLDYNVLPFVFSTRRIKKKDREDVFDSLKVMENAVLRDHAK